MALNDAALVLAANAVEGAIAYFQAHSGARGAAGTDNQIGSRVAVTGSVDADGDITWSNVAFTGLPANSPVPEVSYWSALTGGTYYGGTGSLTGDANANAAGEITVSITETGSAL